MPPQFRRYGMDVAGREHQRYFHRVGRTFPTDDAAYAEFLSTVKEEGMKAFLDDAPLIPLPRH